VYVKKLPPRELLRLVLWLKLPLGTLVPLRHRRRRRLLLRRYEGLLLLPPVPDAVHLDLLPPAIVAAERRVPSAPSIRPIECVFVNNPLLQFTAAIINQSMYTRRHACNGADLYMKMSPQSALRQRVHSSRKLLGSSASVSGTQNMDGARLAVADVGLLPSSAAFALPSVERRGRWACALPPENTAAKSGLPKAWK